MLYPPRPARLLATGLLAAITAASAAAGSVNVTFLQPEKYTDAGYSSPMATERDRAQVLRDVEQHLQRLAERSLPPRDALKVEVLDIDLAGHFPPWNVRGGSEVRVVNDVTGPRIRLRYTLGRDGQVIASAEEHLSDMNFLLPGNRYPGSDRLRYEKALLDRWFEKRFGLR